MIDAETIFRKGCKCEEQTEAGLYGQVRKEQDEDKGDIGVFGTGDTGSDIKG